MSDYQDLVKRESKEFFDTNYPGYLDDTEEFGGKAEKPNFSRWIDRTGKLSQRVEEVMKGWSSKEFHWIQQNTRNKNPHGDLRGNSFGSLLQDILHEVKKIAKAKK